MWSGEDIVATVLHPDDHLRTAPTFLSVPSQNVSRFSGALGLAFAECQFIATSEGPIYCLDVSRAPSYWHCPQEIQQQIVCRLADHLSERGVYRFMILLMGPMADPVLANVCARLAAQNADLMHVHPESGGEGGEITWSTERGWWLTACAWAAVPSVWRMLTPYISV